MDLDLQGSGRAHPAEDAAGQIKPSGSGRDRGEAGAGVMLVGTGVALWSSGSRSGLCVARLTSTLGEGEATEAVTRVLQGLSWKPFGASPLKGPCVFETTIYKEGQRL